MPHNELISKVLSSNAVTTDQDKDPLCQIKLVPMPDQGICFARSSQQISTSAEESKKLFLKSVRLKKNRRIDKQQNTQSQEYTLAVGVLKRIKF